MKQHVNDLLTVARAAFHFYTELRGGDDLADNPGKCIISLCAFSLNQHIITLREGDVTAFNECKAFNDDPGVLAEIIQLLGGRLDALDKLPSGAFEKKVVRLKKAFVEASSVAKAFVLQATDSLSDIDEEDVLPALYQSLFDIKVELEDIEQLLPEAPAA